ncbi:hypothetical protein [Chondromyces crocatus]|uniref:Lipoprotein n=1 Tax=Chondromyces crocatus TaxID=52 RepID=A0A0K1EE07_CHOCO|nr:hypothetical protein [Chondromyces crocatus]AKT38818.1 uncharacterized protein CMC5_029640 [Chondromyces crocatus]
MVISRRWLLGHAWPLALSVLFAPGVSGCGVEQGELMVALETDLIIPKDIDEVSLEVLAGGQVRFAASFPSSGDELRLPGTLGVVVDDPSDRLTVRATAFARGTRRITRQSVTRAPDDGVGLLRLPLSWLCDGVSCEAAGGPADSQNVQTCDVGQCVPASVEVANLPAYDPADVFGGGTGTEDGTCFDVARCFASPVFRDLDPDTCTVDASAGVAVAVQTEGDGACNQQGCFVPLRASQVVPVAGGTALALPATLCARLTARRVVGVAISHTCASWSETQPVCGPWASAASESFSPTTPVTLAGGQQQPQSLFLHEEHVYWTNKGGRASNGEVKRVPRAGGRAERLASTQAQPSGVAVFEPGGGEATRVAWLNEANDAILSKPVLGGGSPTRLAGREGTRGDLFLLTKTDTSTVDRLYWTTSLGFVMTVPAKGGQVEVLASGEQDPSSISAVDDGVLWLARGEQAIRGFMNGGTFHVVDVEGVPNRLAVDATHAYWTVGGVPGQANGKVMRVRWQGEPLIPMPEVIAEGQDYPYAIAVDGADVYWTTWGDGALRRAALDGSEIQTLVRGEPHPTALAVDPSHVYWLSAGTSRAGFADGAVRRVSRDRTP